MNPIKLANLFMRLIKAADTANKKDAEKKLQSMSIPDDVKKFMVPLMLKTFDEHDKLYGIISAAFWNRDAKTADSLLDNLDSSIKNLKDMIKYYIYSISDDEAENKVLEGELGAIEEAHERSTEVTLRYLFSKDNHWDSGTKDKAHRVISLDFHSNMHLLLSLLINNLMKRFGHREY